ncbi:MAG: polymerase subunit sigma-70 [Rhodospirillales bacterium]|jgi:RNA polymerase sigma-70 factor (ECF subfamily)|nr:polymerase subunit sigma-70 [Rhodospirillales bacterium]
MMSQNERMQLDDSVQSTPNPSPVDDAAAEAEFQRELIANIPHLRAFARFVTQNADHANDLVQDTIVRALRARHQFAPGTNFKAWTFTILRNLHVNNLRRQRLKFDSIEDGALDYFAVAPGQEARLEFQELKRGMAKLSREHREVLILVGASGFSYEEAAEICNCAVGTIKSRLSRARTELYRILVGEEAAAKADAAATEPSGEDRKARRRPGRRLETTAAV